jgi:hypothetical protein
LVLRARTRRILAAIGVLLVLLGASVWILPAALSSTSTITQTVQSTEGTTKTTKEAVGWGTLHSDQVTILLVASGLALLFAGMLPTGAIKRVTTALGEVEFAQASLAEIAAIAAVRVSGSEAQGKVKEIEKTFIEALAQLGGTAAARSGDAFRPTRAEIDEAVARAIEKDPT